MAVPLQPPVDCQFVIVRRRAHLWSRANYFQGRITEYEIILIDLIGSTTTVLIDKTDCRREGG